MSFLLASVTMTLAPVELQQFLHHEVPTNFLHGPERQHVQNLYCLVHWTLVSPLSTLTAQFLSLFHCEWLLKVGYFRLPGHG